MKNDKLRLIQKKLEEVQADLRSIESTSTSADGFISLNDLNKTVEQFCKTNGLKMSDIATLSGISSTTLTKALRTPERTTMNTISAVGEIVGFSVLLGRSNV